MTKSTRKFVDFIYNKTSRFMLKQTEMSDLTFTFAVANCETQITKSVTLSTINLTFYDVTWLARNRKQKENQQILLALF